MLKKILVLNLFALGLFAQCNQTSSLTAAGNGDSIDNRTRGCVGIRLTYYTDATAISISVQGASNGLNNSPGTFADISSTVVEGTNPSTTNNQGTITIKAYYPWIRVHVETLTGTSKTVWWSLRAYEGFPQVASSSSSGMTIDTTAITGGAANRILIESATGKLSEDDNLTWTTGDAMRVGLPTSVVLANFGGGAYDPGFSTLISGSTTKDSQFYSIVSASDGYIDTEFDIHYIAAMGDVIPSTGAAATPGVAYEYGRFTWEITDTTSLTSAVFHLGMMADFDAANLDHITINGVGDIGIGKVTAGVGNPVPVTNSNLWIAGVTGNAVLKGTFTAGSYIAGTEQSAPSAPAANGYRLFAQDNGAGKTQLCVIFSSGAAQCFATQP